MSPTNSSCAFLQADKKNRHKASHCQIQRESHEPSTVMPCEEFQHQRNLGCPSSQKLISVNNISELGEQLKMAVNNQVPLFHMIKGER